MSSPALYHRLGTVLEAADTVEQKTNQGRTKRYTKCRVKWDDNGETHWFELSEMYTPGQRTAVIYRGDNYICDLNLATGRQSEIGDRVEGIAALVMLISVPLCFLLIGIPIYYGVTIYSKITTQNLRKRIAVYVEDLMARLHQAPPAAAQ